MRNYFILIFFVCLFLACSKDEQPLSAKFVTDSVVYKSIYNADIYYYVSAEGGSRKNTIKWMNPVSNVGTGPFKTNVKDFYSFSAQVYNKNSSCDINYNYDYRDKIIGTYNITKREKVRISDTIPPFQRDSIFRDVIDTITITKSNDLNLYVMSHIFKPDSTGNYKLFIYHVGMFGTDYTFNIKIYPINDSIIIGENYQYLADINGYISRSIVYFGKKITK